MKQKEFIEWLITCKNKLLYTMQELNESSKSNNSTVKALIEKGILEKKKKKYIGKLQPRI